MNKKIKNNIFSILAFIVTVTIRIYIVFLTNLTYSISYDVASYKNAINNILTGKPDLFRTPLYPILLKLFDIPIHLKSTNLSLIIIIQFIISSVALLIFYFILRKIKVNKYVSAVMTFLYGITTTSYCYDTLLITESLSLSGLITLIYIIISYIKKPSYKKAVLCSIMSLLLIMLRPAFIYLIPVAFVFFMIRLFNKCENKKSIYAGIISLILCSSIILGYASLNYKNYNVFCISNVSTNYNDFTIIIKNDLYKSDMNNPISKDIEYEKAGNNYSDFGTVELLNSKYSPSTCADFVKECKKRNFKKFYKTKLLEANNWMFSNLYSSQYDYFLKTDNKLVSIINNITLLYCFYTLFTYLLTIVSLLLIILLEFVRKHKLNYVLSCFSAIMFCHIAVSLIGGFNDFGRLFSQIQFIPFIIFSMLINFFIIKHNQKKDC